MYHVRTHVPETDQKVVTTVLKDMCGTIPKDVWVCEASIYLIYPQSFLGVFLCVGHEGVNVVLTPFVCFCVFSFYCIRKGIACTKRCDSYISFMGSPQNQPS